MPRTIYETSSSLIHSPVGPLMLTTTEKGIRRLDFMRDAIDRGQAAGASSELGAEVERQVREYFDGTRREFELPLDLEGTDFQRDVWGVIGSIPFGEVLSYGDVAERIGRPTAFRAVGNACGANPVVIVLPCHRVVASGRLMGGFGGGLDTKTWLLKHEGSLSGIKGPRGEKPHQPLLATIRG